MKITGGFQNKSDMNVFHFFPFLLGILLFLWIYPYPTARMVFIPVYILVAYLFTNNWRITLMTLAVIIIISVVLESVYSSRSSFLVKEGFNNDKEKDHENDEDNKKKDDHTTRKSITHGKDGPTTDKSTNNEDFIGLDNKWEDMEGKVNQSINFPNDEETEKVLNENQDLKNLFKSMAYGTTTALEKPEKSNVSDKNTLTDKDIEDIVNDDDEEDTAELFTIKDDEGKKVTPASAQRDVFKMINTMKQLGTSIKAMAPTLVEARKVMDMLNRFDGERKK